MKDRALRLRGYSCRFCPSVSYWPCVGFSIGEKQTIMNNLIL